MTLEERVELLERQISKAATLQQVRDLVNTLTTENTSLTEDLSSAVNTLDVIITQLQDIKEQLENHETRIVALE